MIKKMIAVIIVVTILPWFSWVSANAGYVRVDNIEIGNCRTYSDLRKNDKAFVKLKDSYIMVEGVQIYAGSIYGAEDYDIFGDDEVRCKVQSNAYTHYAVLSTDKKSSVSDDVKKGFSAYTKWVELAGGNGDKGWANFSAGFFVK